MHKRVSFKKWILLHTWSGAIQLLDGATVLIVIVDFMIFP